MESTLKDFLNNLHWMKLHASQHYSIDTFAKKLYIDDNPMLRQLKATLATYFFLEQMHRPLHQRYDTFFAAMISGKRPSIQLPDNVTVLTWNYDSQFEIAYARYRRQWEHVHRHMQCVPLPERAAALDPKKFSLIHLNGAAGFLTADGKFNRIFQAFTLPASIETVSHALLFYAKYMQHPDSFEPQVNFAWETDNPVSQHQLQAALQVAPRTNILVVIGYSFPQFNRSIDRQIIGSMADLYSVYLQGPGKDLPAQKAKVRSMFTYRVREHTDHLSN